MSDNFDKIREDLHAGMVEANEAKAIKLLNVGTDNPNEYHWRFRTPAGDILNISLTREAAD